MKYLTKMIKSIVISILITQYLVVFRYYIVDESMHSFILCAIIGTITVNAIWYTIEL